MQSHWALRVVVWCGVASSAVPWSLSAAAADPLSVAAQVDKLMSEELPLAQKSAVGRASDEVFLRRVSLDLAGRLPTAQEVTAFVLDPASDKRARLVERLLAEPQFGRNWGRFWRDVILYRRTEDRALLASSALESYLTQAINANTPWDQVARAFITARGDIRETGPAALAFAQNGDTSDMAAEVSRIFLGVQISCAQCHDHPSDRWTREQFHQLAAFFTRVAVRTRVVEEQRIYEVVGVDRGVGFGRGGNRPGGRLEHYMPDLDNPRARGTLMQPALFLTGQSLAIGTSDSRRRETLADWVTAKSNPWFATAIVNRIWAELIGEGFYEPIDDIGPDRKPTAPKTVEFLASAFAEQEYDIKWLFAAICATEAYQRQSRSRRGPNQAPFAANCPQRLRADQLLDALTASLGLSFEQRFGGGSFAARGGRRQFDRIFGYDPSNPREEVAGSIPQALFMMNSPQIAAAIDGASPRTMLGRLLSANRDDQEVVVDLYLRCLGREPTAGELATCLDHVQQVGQRTEAFEDVLWSLVNSTEFLYRN